MSSKDYDRAFSQFHIALLNKGFNLDSNLWLYRDSKRQYEIGIKVDREKYNYPVVDDREIVIFYENNNRRNYGYICKLDSIKSYVLLKKLDEMDVFVDDIVELIDAIIEMQNQFYKYVEDIV